MGAEMSIETMKQVLEVLNNNRRKHYSCEDSWYSCPKDPDGCVNDQAGDDCTCGADKSNVEIDAAIAALQEAIAEAEKQELVILAEEQEPVAWRSWNDKDKFGFWDTKAESESWCDLDFDSEPLYTTPPPQRKWVGLTDEDKNDCLVSADPCECLAKSESHQLMEDVETKLREKNT